MVTMMLKRPEPPPLLYNKLRERMAMQETSQVAVNDNGILVK